MQRDRRGPGRPGSGILLALLLSLLSLLTVGHAPAAQAATDPVPPAPPPGVVEGFSPYLPQVSCDPSVKPGIAALRSTLMAAYGGRDLGVVRACSIGSLSEHKEGRAWDWALDASVPAEKALADQFLTWLMAPGPNGMTAYNARRLGVMYVIYDGRIWGSYRASAGWRPYTGGESHGAHLHISLSWSGAMKRTSWWTGRAAGIDYGPCVTTRGEPAKPWTSPRATPCPALVAPKPTATPSPAPTPAPAPAPTPAAPAALRPAADKVSGRALPSRMLYTVRPGDSLSRIAKVWTSTVPAIRSASGLKSDTILVGQRITVPVRSGITKFTWTTLRKGDRGVVVRALQTALRMRPKYRTGLFGDITQGRVNALKAKRGWPTDGVAGPGVWRALGA